MRAFAKFFWPKRCFSFFAAAGVAIAPTIILTHPAMPLSTTSVESGSATQLPAWLQALDLTDDQVRRVFEIDALLEQQLQTILTTAQYSQWQSSQIALSDTVGNGTWTFEDINIELSPYQQTAVNAAFRASLETVLAMLSIEQKRLLLQYLSEEGIIPEAGLTI